MTNKDRYFAMKARIAKQKLELDAKLSKAKHSTIGYYKALGWAYIDTKYESEMGYFGLAPKLVSPELIQKLKLSITEIDKCSQFNSHVFNNPVDMAWNEWLYSSDFDKDWYEGNVIELGDACG